MAKIKISKEELQHDEIMETSEKTIRWIKENLTAVLIGIAVFVVAYSAITYYKSSKQNTLVAANDALTAAMDNYQKAVYGTEWASAERTQQLTAVAEKAQEVEDQYSGTPIARQALFLQGNAYYQAGDDIAVSVSSGEAENTQKAIEIFTRYAAEADNAFDRAKGNLALGYANENAFFLTNQDSFYNNAQAAYDQVVADEDAGFMRYEAMLAKGRLYEFQGQDQKAIELYREIMEARYEPLPSPDETENPNRKALLQLRGQLNTFSLAGTARVRLQALGVDVADEYPTFEKATDDSES
ncbi:tetratricopeptide repeat protein [bacterium]|nr:tetratricopeptide repeat protein [bacterium]